MIVIVKHTDGQEEIVQGVHAVHLHDDGTMSLIFKSGVYLQFGSEVWENAFEYLEDEEW